MPNHRQNPNKIVYAHDVDNTMRAMIALLLLALLPQAQTSHPPKDGKFKVERIPIPHQTSKPYVAPVYPAVHRLTPPPPPKASIPK